MTDIGITIRVAAICLAGSIQVFAASKPNIILILTDDQGYGDLGAHGHPLLKTPNLDRLRGESVRFENFHVSPSCSPTRAALLTGMHEFRNGVTHTITPREELRKDAVLLPQLLQKSGYRTGFVGKWHLGGGRDFDPGERGFGWVSTNVGSVGGHFDPAIIRNGKREKRKGFREDLFFDEAMAFIGETHDEPFFCYLATYSPHAPYAAPEEYVAPYRGKVTEKQAAYFGMIANIDHNVGRLMAFLAERGLDRNTIVVFMNDNGVTEGLDVYNAGMRGCKCTIWEGGTRAMSFWRWPDRWKPHAVDNLAAHLDILPTLCEISGTEPPEQLDGYSLVPLLDSETPVAWHDDRMLFHHVARWPGGLAASHIHAMCGVRQGHRLLLRSVPCDDRACIPHQSQCTTLRRVMNGAESATYTAHDAQFHWGVTPPGHWALFDVKVDPGCRNDLCASEAERVASMSAAYERWWENVYPQMIAAGGDRVTEDRQAARLARAPQKADRNGTAPVPDSPPAPTPAEGAAGGFDEARSEVAKLASLTTAPAMQDAAGFPPDAGMKAVYFDALPYQGKPTKAFAWIGVPQGVGHKVPGVVLVHGGGGTAFREWVEKWNAKGFAAISVAVEGQTSMPGETRGTWKPHQWAGPSRNGIYGDSAAQMSDQWMYHAVADTILANSLLRVQPGVDPDKVGVMGISWGGVITSTVMGIDSRFAFAIPVYGCGGLADAGNQYGRSLGGNELYRKVWDPVLRLGNAKMPALWLSWSGDQHFPLDCQAASYRAAPGSHMVALVPGMNHGHPPAWNRPESYAFAESVVKDGMLWCRQASVTSGAGGARVTFKSDRQLDSATLVFTKDAGITGSRKWEEASAVLVKDDGEWVVTAPLPEGTTAWFVNASCGNLVASSEYQAVVTDTQ